MVLLGGAVVVGVGVGVGVEGCAHPAQKMSARHAQITSTRHFSHIIIFPESGDLVITSISYIKICQAMITTGYSAPFLPFENLGNFIHELITDRLTASANRHHESVKHI
jgi:hypothetical protein